MTTPLTFSAPMLLWGVFVLPLALAAYVFAQRRRSRYAVRFTNLELLAGLVPKTLAWRRHLPASLALLSLGSLLLGLARPHASLPVPREQATIVMVMDTSGSMAATDVQPSRMAAAQMAARRFLDLVPATFRLSLVSFASIANTVVSPTTDRSVVRQGLDTLRAEGGTAMGDALQRAIEVAETARSAQPAETATVPATPAATPAAVPEPDSTAAETAPLPVAILLLSDGANTDGRVQPLQAARAAQEAGIPVYAVALGTPAGTLEIPGAPSGGRGGAPSGLSVPPDEATLRQIAEITGGRFFSAPSAADLQAVYGEIGTYVGFEYERQEVTFAFAAAGAVLLVASGALAVAWSQRFP